MEDNNTYTYTYRKEKKKEQQRMRIIFAVVFVGLLILCNILGALFGNRAAVKAHEAEVSSSLAEIESTTEPPTTEDPSPYKPGEYIVETGGYSLKFRESYSTDSKTYLEIRENTRLNITEIYHDEAAAAAGSEIEYWGKTTYYGYTGWVAMNYLKKAYSENIVTPEELSTTDPSAAEEPGTDTSETQEPAATEAGTTAAPANDMSASSTQAGQSTTAADNAAYAPGDYVVNTGSYTLTFRQTASRTGVAIMAIESGERLSVTKIIETEDAQEEYRYWGQVTYQGHTGYVCMSYLKKAS